MVFRGLKSSVAAAVALPFALLASIACTAPTSASTEETSPAVSSLVVVERSVADDGTARTTGIARFFRGSLDDRTVRTLGVELDIPSAGTCQEIAESNGSFAGATNRGVELEEAGAVTIEASDKSLMLSPRWVPDPIGRVRGTLYSGAWGDADLSSSLVTLRSSNFGDATFVAPRDVSGASVGGAPLGAGAVRVAAGVNELVWTPGETARDVVYADVTSELGRTRCSFADTGHGRVTLPVGNGTISVHRLYRDTHRGAIEVRYDTQVSVTFSSR